MKTEKKDGSTAHDPYVAFRRRIEKMQTRKVDLIFLNFVSEFEIKVDILKLLGALSSANFLRGLPTFSNSY